MINNNNKMSLNTNWEKENEIISEKYFIRLKKYVWVLYMYNIFPINILYTS